MHPRSLGKWKLCTNVDTLDVAINLNHIVFELSYVALSVAPYNIRCIIVIDKDSRVDASPTMLRVEAIVIGEQWFA